MTPSNTQGDTPQHQLTGSSDKSETSDTINIVKRKMREKEEDFMDGLLGRQQNRQLTGSEELEEKDLLIEILMEFGNGVYDKLTAPDSDFWPLLEKAELAIKKLHTKHLAKAKLETEKAKDNAYWERNQLVAALSKIYPAWLGYHKGADWEDDWRTIVYIKIPIHHQVSIGGLGNKDVGKKVQLSWHIHDSDKKYFTHLDPGLEEWDGHTTEEKYDRLAQLASMEKTDDK